MIFINDKYKEVVPQMYRDWQNKLTAEHSFQTERHFNPKDYDGNLFNDKLRPMSLKLEEKKATLIDLKAEQNFLDERAEAGRVTYDDLKIISSAKDDRKLWRTKLRSNGRAWRCVKRAKNFRNRTTKSKRKSIV